MKKEISLHRIEHQLIQIYENYVFVLYFIFVCECVFVCFIPIRWVTLETSNLSLVSSRSLLTL